MRVVIIYSYKQQQGNQGRPKDRWVKLRITLKTCLISRKGTAKPEFDSSAALTVQSADSADRELAGLYPCVEVLNPCPASDKEGVSDFEELAADGSKRMTTRRRRLLTTLIFTATRRLLTSRRAGEVTEAMGADELHQGGVAFASGFRQRQGQGPCPRRRSQPRKIKKVIGDIDEGEMFQQLQINAVPGDLLTLDKPL